MNPELYQQLETIYRQQFDAVLGAARKQLEKSILEINSDEALRQLSLDQSLDQFKFDRVQEILAETFNLAPALEQTTTQLSRCKSECLQLQIQLQYLKSQSKDHRDTVLQLQTKFGQYILHNEAQKNTLDTLKQKSKEQAQQIAHYKMTIRSMQEDMSRIRNEWQKRCQEVQRESSQQCRQLIEEARRDAQAKLDVWLEHISREEGPLVVREDHKIVEQLRQEHAKELKRIKQAHNIQIYQLEQTITNFQIVQKRLKEELRETHQKLIQLSRSQEFQQEKYKEANHLLKSHIEVVVSKHQEEVKERLAEERKLASQAEELMSQLNGASQLIQSKECEISLLKEKILNLESSIKDHKQMKYRLSAEVSEKDARNIELESMIVKGRERQKRLRQRLRVMMMKIEGIRLQSTRLKNQLNLERDQVKYDLDVFKRRINSLSEDIMSYLPIQLQKYEMRYNNKLTSIMSQFDISQKNEAAALEQALKDNEYLRIQLKQCEEVFQSKLEELRRQRHQPRIDAEGELEQLKRTVIKMVRNSYSQKNEIYEKIRDEMEERERQYSDLCEEKEHIQDKNNKLIAGIRKLEGQLQDIQKSKKLLEKELSEVKAELMVKDTMVQEYSKQHKQKENVRSNNRPNREKEIEEIRTMLIKTYEGLGSEPPGEHRRRT